MNDPTKDGKDVKSLPEFLSAMDTRRVKLYERGEWYITSKGDGQAHFWMCAREDGETAVSMCASQVAKIEDLHTPGEGAKCLVCTLYEQGGKGLEYRKKIEQRQAHARRVEFYHEQRERAKQEEREQRKKNKSTTTRSK